MKQPNFQKTKSARVMQVIETVSLAGDGTEAHRYMNFINIGVWTASFWRNHHSMKINKIWTLFQPSSF